MADFEDRWELPTRMRMRIDTALSPGEKLHFITRPDAKQFYLSQSPFFVLAISFSCVTGLVFLVACNMGIKWGDAEPINVANMLLIGVFALAFISTCLRTMWMLVQMYLIANKSVYVLTDNRAIEFHGGFPEKTRFADLKKVTKLQCNKLSNGTGNISFSHSRAVFYAIPNIVGVEKIVRQLIETRGDSEKKLKVKYY